MIPSRHTDPGGISPTICPERFSCFPRHEGLRRSLVLLPIVIVFIANAFEVQGQTRIPITRAFNIGHSRKVGHPVFIRCWAFHRDNPDHRKNRLSLYQLAPSFDGEIIHRQFVSDARFQILRKPFIDDHFIFSGLRWKKGRRLTTYACHHGVRRFSDFRCKRVDQVCENRFPLDFVRDAWLKKDTLGPHFHRTRNIDNGNAIILHRQRFGIEGLFTDQEKIALFLEFQFFLQPGKRKKNCRRRDL